MGGHEVFCISVSQLKRLSQGLCLDTRTAGNLVNERASSCVQTVFAMYMLTQGGQVEACRFCLHEHQRCFTIQLALFLLAYNTLLHVQAQLMQTWFTPDLYQTMVTSSSKVLQLFINTCILLSTIWLTSVKPWTVAAL